MAERRMFAKSIIDSDAFLDMPLSTQALYFHLSMRADDDGFINNPKKLIRMLGSSDDELKVLFAKKFIIGFESGVIVIKHWRIHNYIQKDRYKKTNYTDEMAILGINAINGYTLDTECIQDGDTGKVRLELGKSKSKDIVEERFTFTLKQNFSFSSLSDEYRNKLYAYAVTRDSGTEYQRFEDFHVAKGSKFKDWSRAYSTWLQNAVKFGGTTNTPVITNVQGEDCILIGDKAVKIATLEIVPISRRVVDQVIDQDFVDVSGYNVSGLLSDLAKEKAI